MTKAFDRIRDGLDDIGRWKAGRTKALIFFNGEHHRLTYSQHKALLLGKKGGVASGFKAGLECAAKVVEDAMPSTQDMQSTFICEVLEKAAAAIRAQGSGSA